jgi:hypothetical protein
MIDKHRNVFVGKSREHSLHGINEKGKDVWFWYKIFHCVKKGSFVTLCGHKGKFTNIKEDENPLMCIKCMKILYGDKK